MCYIVACNVAPCLHSKYHFFSFLVPSKAPGKLTTYSRISPHSIRVSWEPVLPKFMNGRLISYRVTYKRVRIGDVIKEYEPVKKAIVGPLETTVMLANLEPYSKYEITIAAKTVKGFGPSASFVYGGMKLSFVFISFFLVSPFLFCFCPSIRRSLDVCLSLCLSIYPSVCLSFFRLYSLLL